METAGFRTKSWPPISLSSRLMQFVNDGWDTPQRRAARVKFSSLQRARKYLICRVCMVRHRWLSANGEFVAQVGCGWSAVDRTSTRSPGERAGSGSSVSQVCEPIGSGDPHSPDGVAECDRYDVAHEFAEADVRSAQHSDG